MNFNFPWLLSTEVYRAIALLLYNSSLSVQLGHVALEHLERRPRGLVEDGQVVREGQQLRVGALGLGGDSIEKFWLGIWLEQWLEFWGLIQ